MPPDERRPGPFDELFKAREAHPENFDTGYEVGAALAHLAMTATKLPWEHYLYLAGRATGSFFTGVIDCGRNNDDEGEKED